MKTGKKGNLIVAVFCLLVGLALIGTGIYYLADGRSTMTGGVIFALGLVICAMFVVTCVMMKKVDRMTLYGIREAVMLMGVMSQK